MAPLPATPCFACSCPPGVVACSCPRYAVTGWTQTTLTLSGKIETPTAANPVFVVYDLPHTKEVRAAIEYRRRRLAQCPDPPLAGPPSARRAWRATYFQALGLVPPPPRRAKCWRSGSPRP